MKDRVFEGDDVSAALRAAAQALGIDPPQLRYVVLEQGRQAAPGVSAQAARIAVLMDATGASAPVPVVARTAPEQASSAPADARTRAQRVLQAFARAAGEPLESEVQETPEALVFRVSGPAEALLLSQGGEPLRALEHLLQRACGRDDTRRIQLISMRYRADRDAFLGQLARSLAASVRGDGAPRETEPLNAYDRRIVHLAVETEPGVRSQGVGEGAARRVAVVPVGDAPPATPEVQ
jgi:spoIIIJ-associated protein